MDDLRKQRRPHRGPVKVFRIIGVTIGGIILAGIFALLFGYVVKLLWNWLMPGLFGLKIITYWQAFGLVILGKLLFGGFGKHYSDYRSDHIHRKVEDRWHKWMGFEEDEWAPKGDYKNWKHYKQYWHDEGKEAFESYLDRIQKEEEKKK